MSFIRTSIRWFVTQLLDAFRYELRKKLLWTVENPRKVTAPSPSRSSHQGLQCFKCLAKLEFLRDLFKFGKTDNSNYRSVVSSLSCPPMLKCFVAFHHNFGNLPKFSQGIIKASQGFLKFSPGGSRSCSLGRSWWPHPWHRPKSRWSRTRAASRCSWSQPH